MKKTRCLSMLVAIIFTLAFLFGCSSQISQQPTQTSGTTELATSTPQATIETTEATTVGTTDVPKKYDFNSTYSEIIFPKVTDLSSLRSLSAAVVKATVIKTDPPMDSEYTYPKRYTTINIDQIFDGYLNVGDKLQISETYYSIPDKNDPNLIHISSVDCSVPLMKNHQYLLFLVRFPGDGNYYGVAGVYLGKFPINEKTLSHRFENLTIEDMEFPIGSKSEYPQELMWKLAEQAYEMYLAQAVNS
jgi:hypothetical protein